MKLLSQTPALQKKVQRVFTLFGKHYAVFYDTTFEVLRVARVIRHKLPDGSKMYEFANSPVWDSERNALMIWATAQAVKGITQSDSTAIVLQAKANAGEQNYQGVIYHLARLEAQYSLLATTRPLVQLAALCLFYKAEIGLGISDSGLVRRTNKWYNDPKMKGFAIEFGLQKMGLPTDKAMKYLSAEGAKTNDLIDYYSKV